MSNGDCLALGRKDRKLTKMTTMSPARTVVKHTIHPPNLLEWQRFRGF